MKKEIIYIEQYALIVSDEDIKDGNLFYFKNGLVTKLFYADSIEYEEGLPVLIENFGENLVFKAKACKKIIAHQPLTDAPILEGVPLLPPFSRCQEDGAENAVMEFKELYGSLGVTDYELSAFSKGYNKAKETYKYTEENLRECCSLIFNALGVGDDITTDEIIQHIQQPKRPKYFECEMEDYGQFDCGVFMKDGEEPKTITNSKGQTELVGEYIYE